MSADEHGRDTTYTLHHCRCDECTAAHTAYNRSRRAERYASTPPASVVHGKPATYNNWGCRCRPCVDAHAARTRQYRAERAS